MSANRWALVDQLLDSALDREPADRDAFLQSACAGDEGLRREVESLLSHHDNAGAFLQTPAVDLTGVDGRAPLRQPFVNGQLGVYCILDVLGVGGMGEVYRAHDPRLARDVAIKIIRPDLLCDADRRRRFIAEARAASTLNHPNIVTVHDIQQADGIDLIVMEYVRGQSLDRVISEGGLSVERAVDYAIQIASALAEAHAAGLVHRDIKPANLMVSDAGRVKVLDFGLAKLVDDAGEEPAQESAIAVNGSRTGTVTGTPAYMSPEQVQRLAVDEKSDVFSFGATLYEMLTGRHPFASAGPADTLGTLSAIVERPAPLLGSMRADADVPNDLERLVGECLQKDPTIRPRAREIARRLQRIQLEGRPRAGGLRTLLRRSAIRMLLIGTLVGVLAGSWRMWSTYVAMQQARTVTLPEIQRLVNQGDYDNAFRLVNSALSVLPDDPQLKQLWLAATIPATIRTEPSGADVAIKDYSNPQASWYSLGRTPLENGRVPVGGLRFRVSANGFEPLEVSAGGAATLARGLTYRLEKAGTAQPGMRRVPAGPTRFLNVDVQVDEYWIDQFEVTNRDFKQFVDNGGYRDPDYWREPFILDGRQLPWDEAIARFRDRTGRPGPAAWAEGTYQQDAADIPVTGISWYEAAAYARFAGKSLPSAFHWARAAGFFSPVIDIVGASNFDGKGPAARGTYPGLGPFGTYDMAGNVTEWIANAVSHSRLTLGGAWNEPGYMFWTPDPHAAFERAPNIGFRCVKYTQLPAIALTVPIPIQNLVASNPPVEKPVDEATFAVYRRMYGYDSRALNETVDGIENMPMWRKETVAFDAAYGNERVRAYLFLPRNVSPPYQVVVGFPPGEAFATRSSRELGPRWAAFIVESGRAFMYPVYKGTYERGPSTLDVGPNAARDEVITWSKDVSRAIDYLQTRADIDSSRIGYYGISAGADAGLVILALEPRVKASVLQSGGRINGEVQLPEANLVNFVPRIRTPTLLVYGRNDAYYPARTFQTPLFRLLGTPAEHKRHAVLDGGHTPARLQDVIREVLQWFDKYLGPVAPR